MKIMVKIKELLANREKLAKYDELTEWKNVFEKTNLQLVEHIHHTEAAMISCGVREFEIPSHIKEIIVNALDDDIKKLEEE